MIAQAKVLNILDRFMEKSRKVNKPYKAIQKTDEYARFNSIFEHGIKDQGKWVSDQLPDLMKSASIPDDLEPLELDQKQRLRGIIKRDMPNLTSYVSQQKTFELLKEFFEWSAKNRYKQWGYMVKSDKLDFTLTNPKYIKQLEDRAAYLMNQSSLDQTTIDDIISSVSESRLDGMTNSEAAQVLSDTFDEVSTSRADMITRTESANAMGDANYATAVENGATTHDWVKADPNGAEDECDDNEAEGEIPIDQEFSSGDLSEPAHPNCVLGGQEVEALDVSAKMTADYNGYAIRITLASGKILAVTPNHLMATPNGWVGAAHLNKGSDLLSASSWNKDVASVVNPNGKATKSLIENVSISDDVILRSMPAAAKDFHGDGISCENIDIVLSNGGLGNNTNANIFKSLCELFFGNRNIARVLLSSFSSFNQFAFLSLAPTNSSVGISSLSTSLFGSHTTIHKPSGLTLGSESNAGLLKALGQSKTTNSRLWSKFLQRFPGKVSLDKIVNVEMFRFHGKVYDLSTGIKMYTLNSIITHNCECYTEAGEINLDNIDVWGGE
jgi:hypothetical protein